MYEFVCTLELASMVFAVPKLSALTILPSLYNIPAISGTKARATNPTAHSYMRARTRANPNVPIA